MTHVDDTEIKDGHYQPGELVDNNKYRIETDSLVQVQVPAQDYQ